MKLNPDCIRDVLLWLEENQGMEQGFDGVLTGSVAEYLSTDMPQHLEDYSADDVLYSIKQMIESGFLNGRRMNVAGADWYQIQDITPMGHEFLGKVRSPENWQKTKSIASKIGAVTLDVLGSVAGKVIAELIKNSM